MTKLRLATIPDDKPVKIAVELPALVHRDLIAYAEILRRAGERADPSKLIPLMVQRFMATDREFGKHRKLMLKDGERSQADPDLGRGDA